MASRRRAVKDQKCPSCSNLFSAQGITAHIKSCQKKQTEAAAFDGFSQLANTVRRDANNRYTNLLAATRQPSHDPAGPSTPDPRPYHSTSQTPSPSPPPLDPSPIDIEQSDFIGADNVDRPVEEPSPPLPRARTLLDTLDNLLFSEQNPITSTSPSHHICIESHTSAGKAPKIIPASRYSPNYTKKSDIPYPTEERPPWHPFRTRLDFEIAELTLATHMNKQQITTLLSLFERCVSDPKSFTINSVADLDKAWTYARTSRASGFVRKEYITSYKGNDVKYEVYVRPLIDWCHELLKNPFFFPKMRWNAEKHFKVEGNKKERIIGEPWTANAWWKIQDCLPSGALPFCIILYADKTRLSTFGTAKAYPVMARCANLPSDLRNGSGVGGGRLVGWLPILDEDAGETGKKVYINFKRVVWHKGFYEILLSVQQYATTGYYAKCTDEITLWLFFFVLIFSADYEEQCVVALTRGSLSNFPCPVCLVPREELANLTVSYPLRTSAEMREIHQSAQELNSTDKDTYLKGFGLRDVENVFWMMNGTDIYSALSWDRLHAYHGGLFSDHLWKQFKEIIDDLGKKEADTVDKQFDLIPRWPGLNHFSSVIKTGEFADGSKYEDMGKLIVFASHNVLTDEETERGYCLLRLIRSFLELDMFSSLTIHTETTLSALGNELLKYGAILDEYIALHPDKNWNFPKNHSHIHMVHDILEKGVTRNLNTKPNEKAHGILKLWYRFKTNFKDVAPQILKMNEQDLIAMMIRMAIDIADEESAVSGDDETEDLDVQSTAGEGPEAKHVSLGSPSSPVSFSEIQELNEGDHGFTRFRVKVSKYLTARLNHHVRLNGENEITPFKLARIHYQSVIDWSMQRDLARVNPQFHGRARNDYVLLKTGNDGEHIFAQLLTIFTVCLEGETHECAHVLPLDGSIDRRTSLSRKRDQDLRFIRVRARKRAESVIIDIQSIVRGSLLVSDYGHDPNELIVIDVTDQDMWWRLKSIKLGTNVRL